MLTLFALATSAFAADPETDTTSIGLGFRAVAETWDDPVLGDFYRTGMIAPTVAGVVPVFGVLSVDVQIGYRRMAGRDESIESRLEIVPMSALVELVYARRSFGDLYIGAGPALAVFSERHPGNLELGDSEVLRGVRGAIDTRLGARIDTGLVRPPNIPAMNGRGVRRLELDVSAGRRFVQPSDTGFKLGAWRFSLGLLARL
jgi:hypothetical protein